MSVPVNLRHLPAHVKQSAYFPGTGSSIGNSTASAGRQNGGNIKTRQSGLVPLSFPSTNTALWDKTPTGMGYTLHIAKERSLHVHILEKTLRLAYRHTSLQHTNGGKTKMFLLGQALTTPDDPGVTVTVDRFDPGRDVPGKPGVVMPTVKLPGDHVIPFMMTINKEFDNTTHSEEGFQHTFELLQHHCSTRNSVDVANLVSLCIHCSCYANDDDITFSLHIAGITIATSLEMTPINSIPIIPTALARNLMGPLNISDVQGSPKSGFVTLDQTRKLLLLFESDPKAYSLPLVGIWLSGITYIGSPIIWATCLRYMMNSSIQERVCNASDGFLVILYSPDKRKPDFYHCTTNDDSLSFQLVGCRENLHVFKNANVSNQAPIQFELRPARDGPNKSVFLEACKQFKPISWNTKTTLPGKSKHQAKKVTLKSNRSDADEDSHMLPRPSPKPIMDKSPTVRPSVPELSLISFVEESQPHNNPPQPSPNWHSNHENDDVFLPTNISTRHIQQQHHSFQQQKENPPQQRRSSKPGHFESRNHDRTRPGPLKDIDQNSPHGRGRRVQSQSKTALRDSKLRQQVVLNHSTSGSPSVQRSNSEPVLIHQERPCVVSGSNEVPQQQIISKQIVTAPPNGQGYVNLSSPANQNMSNRLVGDNQNMNVDGQRNRKFQEQHDHTWNSHAVNPDHRRASAPMPQQNEQSNMIGQNIHKRQSLPNKAEPYRHPQSQLASELNHPQWDAQSRHMAIPTTVQPPSPALSNHNTQPQGAQRKQRSEFTSPHSMGVIPEGNEPIPSPVATSPPDRTSPNRHTADNQVIHPIVGSSGVEGQGRAGGSSSCTGNSLASDDAYEQLQRQEQMIKQLQAQIQMLLQAQAAAAAMSIPSGVMTPPATPISSNQIATSTPSANHASTSPINQHGHTPLNVSPTNSSQPRPVNHQSPPTRPVTPATSPPQPRGVGCSIGVNTGQSLFWSPGNRDVEKTERNVASETNNRKSVQQRSPHSHPTAKDVGNSTFDLDSEPNMSVNVTRDDAHSGISMIGPIEMNSSLDTNSRTSSPKGSPVRTSEVQSPHLSDSFRSPVLGESASTCRPPGRPIVSSDESDDEVIPEDGAPSLLYRDQRKFYDNILGNVKQLLHEPATEKHSAAKSHSSSESSSQSTSESSSSEDSDDEDDVTIATTEEHSLLGMKLSLPEDIELGHVERSAMYRSMHNTSPDFFPRINYVSIVDFTVDSPNLSMEANALAMKYLSDEELAKLSVGFKANSSMTPRKDVNPLLRTALVGNMLTEKSMVGVSSVGFRAVDMSMASRKYMEKYGLLEIKDDEQSKNDSPTKMRKSPKKKKIKSKKKSKRNDIAPPTEAALETPSPAFDPQPQKDERIRATPTLHPNSQQVSPVSETANEQYEPWLKRPAKKHQVQISNKSPVRFQRDQVKGHSERRQGDPKTVGNILDISRLQELPKLL